MLVIGLAGLENSFIWELKLYKELHQPTTDEHKLLNIHLHRGHKEIFNQFKQINAKHYR
jgi:hypothetical protein